jgi:hypothetical protein
MFLVHNSVPLEGRLLCDWCKPAQLVLVSATVTQLLHLDPSTQTAGCGNDPHGAEMG